MKLSVAITMALFTILSANASQAQPVPQTCWNDSLVVPTSLFIADASGKPEGLDAAEVQRLFSAVGIALTWTKSPVAIIDDREDYGGNAMLTEPVVHAMGFHNIIKQLNGDPVSYTLTFAKPVRSIRFRRSGMIAATSSGVSHPPWSATAHDVNGAVVATVSEAGIRSFSDLPGKTFELDGPGIKAVTFAGDDEARIHYAQHCDTRGEFCGYGQANLIVDDLGWCP